jgi:hypothetical protein
MVDLDSDIQYRDENGGKVILGKQQALLYWNYRPGRKLMVESEIQCIQPFSPNPGYRNVNLVKEMLFFQYRLLRLPASLPLEGNQFNSNRSKVHDTAIAKPHLTSDFELRLLNR